MKNSIIFCIFVLVSCSTNNELLQSPPTSTCLQPPKAGGFLIMEEWRNIKGYPGYMVSNYGKIKSIGRNWHKKRGKSKTDKILKPRTRKHGYLAIALYDEYGIRNDISIHRLVADAFIPNPNNYNETNHKDGNKQNNRTGNLEWCSHSYNAIHAVKNGLHKILQGSEMHNAKLNEATVLHLRKVYFNSDIGIRTLAKRYKVSKTTMQHALHGKTWKHI